MKNNLYSFKENFKYCTQSKYIFIKSVLDILFALIIFIISSPLLLLISFLVFLNFGNPILFIQERPGYKNKIFKIYKFRSMHNITNSEGKILPDKIRINKFGYWLRSASLDELPEIINVIKGEMSFVGPRPLLAEYIKYYSDEEIKRHNTKPGITGLAQINGRNLISWEEKFKYDIFYTKNLSFLLDLKILLKTFYKVFMKKGINQKGSVNMPKFHR